MKVLKNAGWYEILTPPEELRAQLLRIEEAGRTCYQSHKPGQDLESARKFVRMIIGRKHESVLEHSCMTVRFNDLSRGFCYDDETQVLTGRGWRFFKDCDLSLDTFASLNPQTMKLEFQKATEKTEEPWDGLMYRVDSQMVDLLVTPNHRMFVRRHDTRAARRGKESWGIQRAEDLLGKRVHYKKNVSVDPEGDGLTDTVVFLGGVTGPFGPGGSTTTTRVFQSPAVSFLRFLGFWLSEGHLDHTPRGSYRIVLTQNEGPGLDAICASIRDLGFSPRISPNGDGKNRRVSFSNLTLFKYLERLGLSRDKYIPRELFNLPPRALRALLDACVMGDGNTHPTNGHRVVYTGSPQLADDLQEVALRVGLSARIRVDNRVGQGHKMPSGQIIQNRHPGYVVSLSGVTRQEPLVNHNGRRHDSLVPYKGTVWCVTVPGGLLYVRRNGVPVWCGNTHEQVRHRLTAISQECISGDALLDKGLTIKQLYDRQSLDVVLRSAGFDRVIPNWAVRAMYKGRAVTHEVTTSLGYRTRTTLNHEFQIPDGTFVRLGILKVGQQVMVNGRPCLLQIDEDITHPDTIVSIVEHGEEDVYDLEMEAPFHNFIADGFVVHNSTRYVDYAKAGDDNPDLDRFQLRFVMPPDRDENALIHIAFPEGHPLLKMGLTPTQMAECYEAFYRALRKAGWRPEDARQFLPIGTKSQIVVSANFREWLHIFKMRCDRYAHWEIRGVMCKLLVECQSLVPGVFDDFKYQGTCERGIPWFAKED